MNTATSKNQTSLGEFNPQRDLALLQQWLNKPHVKQWWGDPHKNLQELSEPASGGEALIRVDSKAVGYIRWQILSRKELREAGLNDLPESVVDIDIAIGEPDYLGLGIGSQALKLLVSRILKSETAPMIMMCTSVKNSRALKAFEMVEYL